MKNSSLVLILCSFLLVNIYTISYASRDEASRDLIQVVGDGAVSAAERLLKEGECDVNYIDEDGNTALSVAVARNDTEMVRTLLRYDADVNVGIGIEQLIREAADGHHNQEMATLLREANVASLCIMQP